MTTIIGILLAIAIIFAIITFTLWRKREEMRRQILGGRCEHGHDIDNSGNPARDCRSLCRCHRSDDDIQPADEA